MLTVNCCQQNEKLPKHKIPPHFRLAAKLMSIALTFTIFYGWDCLLERSGSGLEWLSRTPPHYHLSQGQAASPSQTLARKSR